eukprot:TRINITY_DN13157_c0_g1_i2.p1 TRINITY_DN13157_c0_g1~~TRINITY_DN13157_c0_g1_i2.p1  ORF type:complete len:822 (+),score=267.00 TRINITY_DN13157_c0_g1_i2:358-2823(+)
MEDFVVAGVSALKGSLRSLLLNATTPPPTGGPAAALVQLDTSLTEVLRKGRGKMLKLAFELHAPPPYGTGTPLPSAAALSFFSLLYAVSRDRLSEPAAELLLAVCEACGVAPEQGLAELLGDGCGTETRAVAERLRHLWGLASDEVPQYWLAYCSDPRSGELKLDAVAAALLGDCSQAFAAGTHSIICRSNLPRGTTAELQGMLFSPAATVSPMMPCLLKRWAPALEELCRGGDNPQRAQYARILFRKLRDPGVASAVQLGGVELIGEGGTALPIVAARNPGGNCAAGEGPERLLEREAGQAWRDAMKGSAPVLFQLPAPTMVAAYRVRTGGGPPEEDPAEWDFEVAAGPSGPWRPLHQHRTAPPMARWTWTRELTLSALACFVEWLGPELLAKDPRRPADPVVMDTRRVLAGKDYCLLYFSSAWMADRRELRSDHHTKLIRRLYKHAAKPGRSFEVVLVNGDQSPDAFAGHYADMPWAATVFDVRRRQVLERMCQFAGAPKLVIFDCRTRGPDGDPVLLQEDALDRLQRDPGGRRFPWAPRDDTRDEASPSHVSSSKGGREEAEVEKPPKRKSKKKKFIPVIVLVSLAITAALSAWPLAVGILTWGKGKCTLYEEQVTGAILPPENATGRDVECVRAEDPGQETCNMSMLGAWFVSNGAASLLFLCLFFVLLQRVWVGHLSKWDETVARLWSLVCCEAVVGVLQLVWYVFGNVLIWQSNENVCGDLSSQGRVFLCVTYGIYGFAFALMTSFVLCAPQDEEAPGAEGFSSITAATRRTPGLPPPALGGADDMARRFRERVAASPNRPRRPPRGAQRAGRYQ